MAAKNDITGDSIQTKLATDAYRNNFDNIFGKKKKEEKKNRYFTHVEGFADECKYVVARQDGNSYLHLEDGTTSECGTGVYTLEFCLSNVEEGVWVEVFPE